jgi:hypothetical protein
MTHCEAVPGSRAEVVRISDVKAQYAESGMTQREARATLCVFKSLGLVVVQQLQIYSTCLLNNPK